MIRATMKAFRMILLAGLVVVVTNGAVRAQAPSSCLELAYRTDTTIWNRDSAMVDTCHTSPTYGQIYAKKWFTIDFDDYLINLPYAPADSIMEVSWVSIDSIYSDTRAFFRH